MSGPRRTYPLTIVPGPIVAEPVDDRRAPDACVCPWCSGLGFVTPEQRAAWQAAYRELRTAVVVEREFAIDAFLAEEDSEPPPTAA